jgi:hypothetical protein
MLYLTWEGSMIRFMTVSHNMRKKLSVKVVNANAMNAWHSYCWRCANTPAIQQAAPAQLNKEIAMTLLDGRTAQMRVKLIY